MSKCKLIKLSEIAKVTQGQSPESKYYSTSEGIPFMQGNRTFGMKYPIIDTFTTKTTKIAKKNDVLMSVRAPVGDLNIATCDLCIGRGLSAITSKKNNNEFLYYSLKYNVQNLLRQGSGTTYSSVNKDIINDFDLIVPNDEKSWEAISNLLSSLDSKIELNNKINKELEAMAKTLYDYWFVQFDFPNENGKPYKSSGGKMVYNKELKREIPEGWEVKTLNTITNIIAGGDKPKDFSEYQTSELSIPIYSNGIENEGLYGFTNNARINNPSITISARGTIGYCCLRFKPYLPIVRLISVTPKIQNQIVFFYQAIKNLVFENSGSVQQQLTVPQVSELKIVLPPEFYLTKFEKIGILLFSKIENIKQQNQELAKLRDWLLPMLMNGQVRVEINQDDERL